MLGAPPSFPSIDRWQKMSEREQDTLIDAIAKARRLRLQLRLGLPTILPAARRVMTRRSERKPDLAARRG